MSWSFENLGRAAFTALLFVVIAALGQIPFGEVPPQAYLRLALRTTQARVEICRDRTPAELEALAVHMRRPRACEWHVIPHRLHVRLDGETVLDRVLEPRGARNDRPLVFDQRIALEPGAARLAISFAPVESAADGASAELAEVLALAERHELEQPVQLRAGRIILVRLDGNLVIDG